MTLNFDGFEALTFDCYGTLIDWESGILAALRPVLSSNRLKLSDEHILELYSETELSHQVREYFPYSDLLKKVMRTISGRFKFTLTGTELNCLVKGLPQWAPFPDTVSALKKLKSKYKLAVISNIDEALFAETAKRLEVPFDWVFTAEQTKSYKPSLQNFRNALQKMELPPEKVLHVAQSLYHDIAPAKTLGLAAVWVNRRKGKEGPGATPPAKAEPDLTVSDLSELASLAGLES